MSEKGVITRIRSVEITPAQPYDSTMDNYSPPQHNGSIPIYMEILTVPKWIVSIEMEWIPITGGNYVISIETEALPYLINTENTQKLKEYSRAYLKKTPGERGTLPAILENPTTAVLKTSIKTEGMPRVTNSEVPPHSNEKFSNYVSKQTETVPI